MACWFIIPPGTRVWVSQEGSAFDAQTLSRPRQFTQLGALEGDFATFHDNGRTYRVGRKDVVRCDYNGQHGTNTWGI